MVKHTHKDIKEMLSKCKLKATYQRIVIYEALTELDHPTAECIYEAVGEKYPTISLATIYKTLESFQQAGLVNKVRAGKERFRYDPNTFTHNHLFCQKTGRIIDYRDEELEKKIYDHLKEKNVNQNFHIRNIQLHIDGELKDTDQ